MSVNFFAQGLRNMLPQAAVNGGKHSTMDSATQNMALQQLRGSAAVADAQTRLMTLQNKLPMPGETYVSPDNLRDTATRMFARNQGRNSIALLKSQQTFQQTFQHSFYSSVGHPVVLETLLKSLLKSLLRFQQSY